MSRPMRLPVGDVHRFPVPGCFSRPGSPAASWRSPGAIGHGAASLLERVYVSFAPWSGGAVIIQTIHPFADAGAGRYEDGWREEGFRGMKTEFSAAMPWYFRTVGTSIAALRDAAFQLEACREPIHPETGRPLSLLPSGRH
jgi:hypothetical protein